LSTAKHQNLTNFNKKVPESSNHICNNCNKTYKSRVGLWYHEKKCDNKDKNKTFINVQEITPSMILSVIQQNQELQKHLEPKDEVVDIIIVSPVGIFNNFVDDLQLILGRDKDKEKNLEETEKTSIKLQYNVTDDSIPIAEFQPGIKVKLIEYNWAKKCNVSWDGITYGVENPCSTTSST
jgi:ribosomal protein L37AE/L43A